MGDQARLGPFIAEDSFLRHIDRKRRATADGVNWEVFKPRPAERSLSFTYQDVRLMSDSGLDEYRLDKAMPSGDLPGICKLTYYDLTEALEPPLPPRPRHDPEDPKYGDLHCETGLPRDQIHMEKMAKLATRNGVLRVFERGKK